MTSKKKIVLAGVLVLIMAVSAVGGTVAYLTASDSLSNTFLVGAFTPPKDPIPTPDPPIVPNPGDPDDPNPPAPPSKPNDGQKGRPNGFLYEPYWNANGNVTYTDADNHRLMAGNTTVKDPYVGLGKDSESAYVLVYIQNPIGNQVYFSLGKGWLPVDGQATEVTINASNGSPTYRADGSDATKYYSGGLFKWAGVNAAGETNPAPDTLGVLNPDTDGDQTGDEEVWTEHPVFTWVYTAKNGMDAIQAMDEAKQKMVVYAFIHQTNGYAEGASSKTDADYDTVIQAATTWANKIKTSP